MRNVMKVALLSAIAILLTACISIPLGDGNKMKLSKDGITFTDADGDETNISLDTEEGSFNISGGKDGEEIDFTLGVDLDVPDDFPKEIPIVEDAKIGNSTKVSEGEGRSITYSTNESFEQVQQLYKNYVMANYEEHELVSDQEQEQLETDEGLEVAVEEWNFADFMQGKRGNEVFKVNILFNENADDNEELSQRGLVTLVHYFETEEETDNEEE